MKRLTRVLVYEGPDSWIMDCIAHREIRGNEPLSWLSDFRTIIETKMTVETLSDDKAKPKENSK